MRKAQATILVRVKGKLEVELTREEAEELQAQLHEALGMKIIIKLAHKLAVVEQERKLKNMTPFTMIPPTVYGAPPPIDPKTIQCKE